jgi:predicted O-methyltransferase YrrM
LTLKDAGFARKPSIDTSDCRLETQVDLKSTVLRLLLRANYAVVHADALERERRAGVVNANRLRRLGGIPATADAPDDPPQPQPADNAPPDPIRPLTKITRDADFPDGVTIDREWVAQQLPSKHFAEVVNEFRDYPPRSLVSVTERAVLFCLIRAIKPRAVAEIGTAFCGTSEVIARALWENGMGGVLYTTDPFGAERCPPILERWPLPLQETTRFYVKSSMDFILALSDSNTTLDVAFVDGNHDFEFAYFDIAMAARLLRPGGIMIIDNSEQSGPYYAAAQFVEHNPDWIELGDALSSFRRSEPFHLERSSVPGGGFLMLRAPDHYAIGEVPRSTGQILISGSRVDGLTATIASTDFRGTLHYQMIFRAFRNGNREVEEYRRSGRIRLDAATTGRELIHRLDEPLISHLNERHGDCHHTLEIELAWEGADAQSTIRLCAAPRPLLPEPAPSDCGVGGRAEAASETDGHPRLGKN